jgi:hypothetical protein
MTPTDQAVVAFVIAMFCVFGLALGFASWQEARAPKNDKRPRR